MEMTDPRLKDAETFATFPAAHRARMIQVRAERPMYVSPDGETFSFADHNRAYAIQRKHGGVVYPPLRSAEITSDKATGATP